MRRPHLTREFAMLLPGLSLRDGAFQYVEPADFAAGLCDEIPRDFEAHADTRSDFAIAIRRPRSPRKLCEPQLQRQVRRPHVSKQTSRYTQTHW